MKQCLCLLLIVLLKVTLPAQQLLIMDSTATAIVAKVDATRIDDNKKTKGITVEGVFVLPAKGTYKIRVHAIGFEDYNQTLTIEDKQSVKIILISSVTLMDDIVVTGEIGNKTPKNSVIPIKVIDSKKIALLSAQNLRDVLTNESGIRISEDMILGSSISVQGISGENVKILIDGVPIIGRQNGNIDLSQIDMSNIERIEIVEGPMSVNYGTNALGGVINIITKKGSTQKQTLAVKTYYETIGTYNLGVVANTHLKKLTLQLTASRNFFDGWNTNDQYEAFPKSHPADTNRFTTWKPKTQYNAGLNLGYQFKYWNIKYKISSFQEMIINRGMPRAPYFEEAYDDTYKTQRFDHSVLFNYAKVVGQSFNTQVSYNNYRREKNTYCTDLTTLNKKLTSNREDQDTSKFDLLNLRSSYIASYKKIDYEIGADLNVERASGLRLLPNMHPLSDIALFAVSEYQASSALTFRGGLRGAYNTNYHAPILPSLNAKWYINSRNILRLSYAEGFKAPSLKELYFYFVDFNHNIVGNTNLKAETSKSINLQYNYVTMVGKTFFKMELKTFYNQINNLITLAQLQGLSYTYINIGRYKTTGIQANTDFAFENLKFNFGINYVGRYNQLSPSQQVASFSFSPEYISSVSYFFTKFKTQVNLFYKFNGKLPSYILDGNKNIILQNIASYHWADASITKIFYKNISVSTGIKNIFNLQNITTTGDGGFHQTGNQMPIGAGRFYFLNINYSIQK